ncbi:MAG: hypothetical protein ACM3X6_06465 [Patescibacteria group bacterium]
MEDGLHVRPEIAAAAANFSTGPVVIPFANLPEAMNHTIWRLANEKLKAADIAIITWADLGMKRPPSHKKVPLAEAMKSILVSMGRQS